MQNDTGPRGGCTYAFIGFVIVFVVFIALAIKANAADLTLPPIIVCGSPSCDGDVSKFGKYGDRYYARRWKRMCKTGARYEAMREADDLGKKNPC